jgi:predicted NAD/FAD-binding protein
VKIAVIGTGIAGLTAAYLLHRDFDLTVYEANGYVGGHTNTVEVELPEGRYAVDTGFIVFNEVTYPNFCRILERLGVDSQPSQMTFSVKCEKTGLEYNPHNLNSFFAQRRNLVSPSFWRMILEIFRFRSRFDHLLKVSDQAVPLLRTLRDQGFSSRFLEQFITPLGASLWSADPKSFSEFPLQAFVRFFKNHGFLDIRNPFPWRVIRGGSRRYVEKLTAGFADRIRTSTPVTGIQRFEDRVEVTDARGEKAAYDQVILAVHSDQALALLADATPAEKDILGAIPYQENDTVLHTDSRILPERRWIWASWNYLIPKETHSRGILTYDMNILQTLRASQEFCVTLNRTEVIDPREIKARFTYHHPVFTTRAPEAQKRHSEISGLNRTHFCGAYWGYGFHEDGVRSALPVARWFGKEL